MDNDLTVREMDKHTLCPPPPFKSRTWNFPEKIFHDTLREEHWHVEQYKSPVEKYQNPHTNMSSVREIWSCQFNTFRSQRWALLWRAGQCQSPLPPSYWPRPYPLSPCQTPHACHPAWKNTKKWIHVKKSDICSLAVGYLQIWKLIHVKKSDMYFSCRIFTDLKTDTCKEIRQICILAVGYLQICITFCNHLLGENRGIQPFPHLYIHNYKCTCENYHGSK